MYEILNALTGEQVGYTMKPYFIKKNKNSIYVPTDEAEAEGIAYEGKVYNLYGKGNYEDLDTVSLLETDEGSLLNTISTLKSTIAALEDALCEIDKEAQR